MNRIQAVDAANVIMHIRPDWQQAGIISILLQLDLTYPAAILHSVRVAANPNSRNPGAIIATPAQTETATRRQPDGEIPSWEQILLCPYCDPHGYLPNGFLCHHEPPEAAAERAHRGAALARAALGAPSRQSRDEPYLPADLTAETQTRLETSHQHQWTDGVDLLARDNNLIVCTVCGFEAPRNLANLDGTDTQPPYHDGPRCVTCNEPLVWRRTPLLPAPAGIWQHETDPDDDHPVVVPWAAPAQPKEPA